MMLSSRSNTNIKHLRSLEQRKARIAQQVFAVEGLGLIREALSAGFVLRQIYALEGLEVPPAPETFWLSPELMAYVSTLPSPPQAIGVFAAGAPKQDPTRRPAWLLADRLQDPGNFGALLRLADAMNWRGVLAFGAHPDPFSPKVIRGSMASCLRVPVQSIGIETLAEWRTRGWTLLGTAADAPLSSLDCSLPSQLILALGHEGQGLDPALLPLCDQTVAIPIRAGVDSLNVATSAAMLMHEFARQYPEPR